MITEKSNMRQTAAETATEDIFGDSVYTDISEEFTLPEYEPEIRKILRVSAKVLPAGKYVGAGRAEFAGTVVYGLIYQGAEGECASVSLSSDYEFAVPMPSDDREVAIYADTETDSVACRPVAARRLQFRTKLKSRIQMIVPSAFPECSAPPDAEILRNAGITSRTGRCTSGEFDVTGALGYVNGNPLACDGTVFVSEISPGNGSVKCRGEVWVRAVYAGERMESAERKIPFETEIEAEGVTPDCYVRAVPRCWSCEVSVQDGGGEAEVSAVVEIEAEWCKNIVVPVTEDGYIPGKQSSIEKKRVYLAACRFCRSFNISASGSKALTGEDAKYRNVTAIWGEVDVDQPDADGDKAQFRGVATVHGVLTDSTDVNAAGECSPFKMEIPFKAFADAVGIPGGGQQSSCRSGELVGARVRVEKGTVFADVEIAISASVTEKKQVTTLVSVAADETSEIKESRPGLKAIYPTDGDTLWKIAKKHRVSIASVCALNGIGEEAGADPDSTHSVDGAGTLLIKK